MADKKKPRRLSETVVPGKDFADKRKIDDVLGREVLILNIEKVPGSKKFAKVDADTGELIIRDYWNVIIQDGDDKVTFSTGAVPIDKVFEALAGKLSTGEAEYPLLATFSESGETYVVE